MASPEHLDDKAILDWMEQYIDGDNTLEFSEEDGGVILHVGERGARNVAVGMTVREAVQEAIAALNPEPL